MFTASWLLAVNSADTTFPTYRENNKKSKFQLYKDKKLQSKAFFPPPPGSPSGPFMWKVSEVDKNIQFILISGIQS